MKVIMKVKTKVGRVRNVRLLAWTNVFIPEEEYNRSGITQEAIRRAITAAGKKVDQNRCYQYKDYGWFPKFKEVGKVYEENGKLFKEANGKTEEVTTAQVAYWRTMASLSKSSDLVL
jgi:hypothetical protein